MNVFFSVTMTSFAICLSRADDVIPDFLGGLTPIWERSSTPAPTTKPRDVTQSPKIGVIKARFWGGFGVGAITAFLITILAFTVFRYMRRRRNEGNAQFAPLNEIEESL